jgi:hypothetical protein
MTWSRVENGYAFDLPGQIWEQQLIEIVDDGVEVATSSCCRRLRLPEVS